jgi:hypothetical protein
MGKEAKKGSKQKLEPLKITCTSADCEENLHCFRATRKMKGANQTGACRECGTKLIDWDRVHAKDVRDAEYTFQSLKCEMIRHYFWHVEIDPKAQNYAQRKGISGLETAVKARLRSSVEKPNNPFDGRQTPMAGSGNPIHYGQHATASCCRKCMEYWHGIPTGTYLTTEQIEYFASLILMFLKERMPNLEFQGKNVPPIRSTDTEVSVEIN